ncbi:MAG TPA: ABC transporter substrate-binding protein, partial [Aggregicoccus sp.]|nr:ABC transporter substrate-binding protein [Aggregicoccus sp.]
LGTACGGAQQGGGSTSANLTPKGFAFKQPVQLTYWKSLEGPRHDAQVKLTDDFNAQRADVKVALEHVGAYAAAAQKLTAALAGNTPPDVMLLTVDQHMPAFARQGALLPLDEFARSDRSAQFETYATGFIKNGTKGGKLYQIPLARSTPLLYYNKDHFKAAGLPDVAPGTWDQVVELGQKLTRANVTQAASEEPRVRAVPVASGWWPFQSILWAFGGKYSDDKFTPAVTQNESVQAMQFLVDLVKRHQAARAYKGSAQNAFLQGQLSMVFESTANLTQVERAAPFRVGAAFMPRQKERAVPGGGSGLTIIKSIPREKQEAGWEYMKFFTNTPNTIYFSQQTGYMVVRTDAADSPEYKKFLADNPNAKVTFDQMQYVRTQDSIVEVPQVTPAIESFMWQALGEDKTPRAVMEELARQMTSLASSIKK